MRIRNAFGITAGLVLILSSLAHAFGGWPAMEQALVAGNADPALIGALGVGWHFGSMAMLAFGIIVTFAAWNAARGNMVSMIPPRVIALAYVVFGLVAFVSRGFKPHFLFFVAAGLLIGIFAFWRQA